VQINISTRHGHLSEASREKIVAKLEKLERFFERLTAIDVTIELTDEENPRVDIQVSAEHKHDFLATDQSDNLMGSVDNAVQKMEQQLRKYKEKVQDRHRNPGARRLDTSANPSAEDQV
jgi:ribosome hibernation promoting factor